MMLSFRRRARRTAAFSFVATAPPAAPRQEPFASPHVYLWFHKKTGGLSMLYWLPRVCVVAFAGLLIGFGFIPHTAVGVAHTLLIIVLGLGLLSLTLHVFPPERH
ncbi:hypothetical protein [Ensifer sp. Root31]|uniref:hypothetical protein n=1 Tax=Ensifer sp. Root31 TaxID=1736512 RepID=UPI0012E729F7|nr:hypothetical protein [Ensifer sp. Root31]